MKFSLRSLGKYKMYTLVNLLGLTLGLGAVLIITLYVIDELSFDKYHSNSSRIFQVTGSQAIPGRETVQTASLPAPLGTELKSRFPQVENLFRLIVLGRADLTYEGNGYYETVLAADPAIFDMLDFGFIQGDPASALSDPNAIVLTESAAVKYFGNENPIGKILSGNRGQNTVTAVIADPPANSHLQFSALFPFPPYLNIFIPDWSNNWDANSFISYVQLSQGSNADQLAAELTNYIQNESPMNDGDAYTFSMLPLPDIHFHSENIQGQVNYAAGDISVVYTLAAIAVFILSIACINYTNLATARSINRTREISLRKLLGARRLHLFIQLLTEAITLTFAAFVLAMLLAWLILPMTNGLVDKNLSLSFFLQPGLFFIALTVVLIIGIAAGAYPAMILSRQSVSVGLTDNQSALKTSGRMRKILVVAQFSLSVILVFCTLTVFDQMAYIQSKPLGFNENNVIAVDINSPAARNNAQAIKDELLSNPDVLAVSNSNRLPGDWKNITQVTGLVPGQDISNTRNFDFNSIDEHYLETFNIGLARGRNFEPSDSIENILVNQTLVELMGWSQPIGQQITIASNANPTVDEVLLEANVIGVVEDFHYQSLHQSIGPLVLGNGMTQVNPLLPHDYFSIRVSENNIPDTIEYLREVMQRHDPATPFEYNFIESQMQSTFYSSDRMTAILFTVAASLAVFIASMGLFGLSSFTTEQRRKEIGIRKVLGATIANIVELLSADFMKLVLVAIFIALPAGYYLMNLWLQTFAYSQGIKASIYVTAALLAIVVSMATVSIQSVRAAMRSPVDSIACE